MAITKKNININDDLIDDINLYSINEILKANKPKAVSDIDGFELNKARERTFNKDLSDLVDKIKSQESSPSAADNLENIDEKELLQKYHKLFYKSVNLINLNTINSDLNQYELDNDLLSYDAQKNNQHIINAMLGLSLSNFSILLYNIKKRSYVPYIHHIDFHNKDNIAISITEDFYSYILNSTNGIIIDRNFLENNKHLNKRFAGENHEDNNLYFLSIKNIVHNFIPGLEEETLINDLTLYPILMVSGNFSDQKKIFNTIRNRMLIPFLYLEKDVLQKRIKNNNLTHVHDNIDTILRILINKNNYICYTLRSLKSKETEATFVISYLYTKIQKYFNDRTLILRTGLDNLLIIINKTDKKNLEDLLHDINLHFNSFIFDIFSPDYSGLPEKIFKSCLY